MGKIIPTPDEEPEKLDSEISESQILNSRNNKDSLESALGVSKDSKESAGISTFPEIQEDFNQIESLVEKILEPKFTIDDLIDVWSRGMTNGATLWQYCQEKGYNLPVAFEAGSLELVNEVRNSKDKAHALQQIINNNMILLGVFEEKQ